MNDTTKPLSKVIRIDESEIRGHLDEMVRGTVEETLNAMLDAEASLSRADGSGHNVWGAVAREVRARTVANSAGASSSSGAIIVCGSLW